MLGPIPPTKHKKPTEKMAAAFILASFLLTGLSYRITRQGGKQLFMVRTVGTTECFQGLF